MSTALEQIRGRLVVSCQAYPGEPMRDPVTMARVAQAAVLGGAAAVRVQGLADIAAAHTAVDVPVIGLVKDGDGPVVITPTLRQAVEVAGAGSDLVAVDGTRRERPDGHSLVEVIHAVHEETGRLVLADVGSLDDARAAIDAGADAVATTLSGYTAERPAGPGPDLELVARIATDSPVPVIAEGRIHTPEQAAAAKRAGAWAVVVGTAITHPTTLTSWFVQSLGP